MFGQCPHRKAIRELLVKLERRNVILTDIQGISRVQDNAITIRFSVWCLCFEQPSCFVQVITSARNTEKTNRNGCGHVACELSCGCHVSLAIRTETPLPHVAPCPGVPHFNNRGLHVSTLRKRNIVSCSSRPSPHPTPPPTSPGLQPRASSGVTFYGVSQRKVCGLPVSASPLPE